MEQNGKMLISRVIAKASGENFIEHRWIMTLHNAELDNLDPKCVAARCYSQVIGQMATHMPPNDEQSHLRLIPAYLFVLTMNMTHQDKA